MHARGPQDSRLYRWVAMLVRPRRLVVLEREGGQHAPGVAFWVVSAAVSLAILWAASAVGGQIMLSVALAPSAFLLISAPMSPQASPRAIVGSHLAACLAGLGARWVAGQIWSGLEGTLSGGLSANSAATLALAMILTGGAMALGRCVHPPALGTALLVTLGFIVSARALLSAVGGALLLVALAQVSARWLAGLPYPLWTVDPRVSRHYGAMAGLSEQSTPFWEQLEARLLRRR